MGAERVCCEKRSGDALLHGSERESLINTLPAIYGRMTDKQKALEIVTQALSSVIDEPDAAGPAWATLGSLDRKSVV